MVNDSDECSADYDLITVGTAAKGPSSTVLEGNLSAAATPLRDGQNLSWNFFDQVSILDNQLRNEEQQDKKEILLETNGSASLMTKSKLQQSSSSSTNTYRRQSPLTGDILWNNETNCNSATNSVNRKHHNNNNNSSSNHHTKASAGTANGKPLAGSVVIDGNDFPHFRHDDAMRLDGSLSRTNRGHGSAAGAPAVRAKPNMGAADAARIGSGFQERIDYNLGLHGWRKKCLFTLILVLMLLIIVNLVLTLWILKVMEFSSEGMGQLRIVPGGIQLTGQTLVMDLLRASTIRSRHGQPIALESSRNFSINTRDRNGILENHLFLGHDKLECLASGFSINDTTGRNLFSVNRNEVTIGAHSLRIDGEGGAIFRESVQTPHVRAEAGRELRLESPTRQLDMSAAKDISFQSRAGGLEINALDDIKLSAFDGSIRLESPTIVMPNLRTAQPPLPGAAQSRDHSHRVFQLCACANGKLFLASPHGVCAGDDSIVCR